MVLDRKLVNDFVSDIYLGSDNSLESQFNIVDKYVQKLGFEGVSYCFAPSFVLDNSIDKAPIFIYSDLFSDSFIDQYINERFDLNDFVIRRVNNNKFSEADWRYYQDSDELNSVEKQQLLIAAQDHGISNAISFPVMKDSQGAACVTITSSAKDSDFLKLKQERLETLKLIIDIYHRSNTDINAYFIKPYFSNFTAKEVTILKYLSEGNYLKNIADETGISHSYASNVLSKLRKKLGSVTHDKLMYNLGVFRVLDDL